MTLTRWDFLFILFVYLKLAGVIDWSWWWVTCPLWASVILQSIIKVIQKYNKK